jgi:retron-type reverse transcriptase
MDRFIQQMLLQVMTPIFDPLFSEHSYGFRPRTGVLHRALSNAVLQRYGFVMPSDLAASS